LRVKVRNMKKRFYIQLLWGLPVSLYAVDANAWGLYTHIFFSQWLLMAIPLLDPRIQQAVEKFPKLVLAGACLPDLAVISRDFNTTHQWDKAELMIQGACSDEEIAIAIGYSSHLFVDVIAHNHFVPAHEAKWENESIVTHISSEWAMDAHIAKYTPHSPHHLILTYLDILTEFIHPHFGVSRKLVKRKLRLLAWLDGLLRVSQLATFILLFIKFRDKALIKDFDYYLTKTSHALTHFESSTFGNRPSWEAEQKRLEAAEMDAWREQCLRDLSTRLATPINYHHAKSA
jgi:hypothetical protein